MRENSVDQSFEPILVRDKPYDFAFAWHGIALTGLGILPSPGCLRVIAKITSLIPALDR
jgi:hypothetical protein